ncbi:histidine phosphatase family protein [Radiobacillus sp. PE A8.2]|uniref:histidine phosphatase family protein n=1 Tax=Radiobacillus sp. PE A8.2 TaxID=3380349 RepID=UPI00388CF5F5
MKVGLVRHFPVKRGYPNNYLTSNELMEWADEYDLSEVIETDIVLGDNQWVRCFASDLPRASTTARKVFNGEITYLKELREISISPFFRGNIKLPIFIHFIFIRVSWWFNHKSQNESKKDVDKRIETTLDQILTSKQNVLIVSHGGLMINLRRQLIKRGFNGPRFTTPKNAKLYVYEKQR